MMSNDILLTKCAVCGENANEPYIECCECDASLCTSCFATGQEVGGHKNNHKYAVRKNDFPLFDNCNWSSKEECKLLSALSTYGYGNWEEISKMVHSRSKLECHEHYKKYYIENVQYKELKLLPETEQSLFPKIVTPYLYSVDISTNPPRNNQGDQHLAGYNAYRSEFELSYDHNAESIFNIEDAYSDDENDECMDALKVSLVSALNTRLRERQRRYEIIQNHGLIMPNKLISWVQKFDRILTRHKSERLLAFMQFMTGMQFDAFMESLSVEAEILQRITKLIEYRKNGIRTLYCAGLYKELKKEHDVVMKEQKYNTMIMQRKFESQSPVKMSGKVCFTKDLQVKKYKRQMNPLEIIDLPGFIHLSDSEKTLCSNLRLIPRNYLEIKEQLIAENNKLGYLRLLDARRIVKIDVNKTRKIYDYLITEGFIYKPL
ncbi:transcriptional adapter 2A [Cydia fagiglandana]|uniref:transcriptional adapter 2A n=1 Tax=Cydia fagiglandana TaxID=1458189 RepID=UPI002FEDE9EA